jgi:phosphatidylglycerophosphate synthase
MHLVQRTPLAWLPTVVALLTVISVADGVGPTGWAAGFACAAAGTLLLDEALLDERGASTGRACLGPADLVTLTRATIACGVAGLVADSFLRPAPVDLLVGLTAVALALDWVDGRVARRTQTVTARGARFDMEVDAFLILVLSVYAADALGPWVLAIGLARYALLLAEQVLPWLRRPIPPRPWGKVVAAVQGIVLAVVASGLLPTSVATVALVLALLLLTESFGHQVGWLWRTRRAGARRLLARRLPPARVVVTAPAPQESPVPGAPQVEGAV